MLIEQKIGNINSFEINNREIDYLLLEWFETKKRILHKKTVGGVEVVMKFMEKNQQLTEGDVIFANEHTLVVIDIIPCDAIIIHPASMFEMASACYEIGNKHLPLFYQGDELMVEYEEPLFQLLSNMGYQTEKGNRKLIHPLKTSVLPHINLGEGLFSNLMKLKTP